MSSPTDASADVVGSATTDKLSPEEFIQAIVRSQLLDKGAAQAALLQALRTLPSGVIPTSRLLARQFVREGTLSQFQAERLLAGQERGLVLGPFHLLAALGRGGMGCVYLSRDSRTNQLLALKILPPKKAREGEHLVARFQREMTLARKVAHPNLTQTYSCGVIQGVYYIAMEYIPGRTLSRIVQVQGPMTATRAARLFSEVADGLSHAHQQGLIHRDLKPGNIMVTPNGHAKILDLGLAMVAGEKPPSDRTIVGGQGYVVGTMDYIAPEQVEDPTGIDFRSDLYALGCSIYFALAGQPPFPGGSSVQKMLRHQTEYPEPLTNLNPTVPIEFEQLVDQLMAKKPQSRPTSAEAARAALMQWVGDEPELPADEPARAISPQTIVDLDVAQALETDAVWSSLDTSMTECDRSEKTTSGSGWFGRLLRRM